MASRNALVAVLLLLSVVCAMGARQLPAADAIVADSALTVLPVAQSRQLQGNADTKSPSKTAPARTQDPEKRFELVRGAGTKP